MANQKSEDLGTIEAPPPPPAQLGKRRVVVSEEWVRLTIALILLALLILTLFLANFRPDKQWDHTKELLQIFVPVESGLLGSAVGFYFGSKKAG